MNYENRVICFIDILGFKDLVDATVDKNGSENSDKLKLLLRALNRIKQMVSSLDLDITESKRITQFSDSIVISFQYKEESEVFMTLLSLQHLILDLVRDGILIRGGITSGKLIHTKDILVGPAMIEAYILESQAANYPRIIIDDSIFEIAARYRRKGHRVSDELESIGKLVGKDSDGMHYVEYLKEVDMEMDEPEYDYPIYLHVISQIIKKGISHRNPSVRVKYAWLKEKYNEIVIPLKESAKISDFLEPEVVDAYAALPVFDSIDLGILTAADVID